MNILTMNANGINVLGRLGENDYTQARFDVDAWLSEYPAGQITLLNQRSGDADAYPVAGVRVSGSTVLWTVSDTDLSREGVGRCELIMLVDGVVAKSAIYMTKVLPALDGSGEAPEPWESWQVEFAALKDEAVVAADDAVAASEAVQDMGVDAVTLEPGSDATVVKTVDPETGAVTLTFGVPAGESGGQAVSPRATVVKVGGTATITITDFEGTTTASVSDGERGPAGPQGETGSAGSDGVSPTVQVSAITGGHRVTVTDATGAHTFDVMDGEQGAPGAPGATGATGNGIASVVKTGTSGLVDTYTITYTNGTSTTYTVTNGAQGQQGPQGVPGSDYVLTAQDKADIADIVLGELPVYNGGVI